MSTSGVTSSLLSQIASSPSAANQFVTDLNQLAQDLQGGNITTAQQDYVTLSQDALDGATSSTAASSASGITTTLLSEIASGSDSSTPFVNELGQLGADLQNGDLSSAQGDMLALDSTALNTAPAASTGTGGSTGSTGSVTQGNQAEASELIHAIVQAMGTGDNSAVSSALSELASVSSSSAGATVLEQESQNFGSSSGSTTSGSSISQLLQDSSTSNADSSTSVLSLLA